MIIGIVVSICFEVLGGSFDPTIKEEGGVGGIDKLKFRKDYFRQKKLGGQTMCLLLNSPEFATKTNFQLFRLALSASSISSTVIWPFHPPASFMAIKNPLPLYKRSSLEIFGLNPYWCSLSLSHCKKFAWWNME